MVLSRPIAMGRERRGRVAGVVLAAGTSSRMGVNKLLLRMGGSTVLARAVRTASAGGLDPVLVVVGHEGARIRAELTGLPCIPVPNPEYARGMSTSLRAGIAAVPADAVAAVVMLADMPFVRAEMVAALLERFCGGAAPLVVSVYGDVPAPPTLYGRALFDELGGAGGEAGGKSVIDRHRAEAIEVAWPVSALADLDAPEDVESARALLEGEER